MNNEVIEDICEICETINMYNVSSESLNVFK